MIALPGDAFSLATGLRERGSRSETFGLGGPGGRGGGDGIYCIIATPGDLDGVLNILVLQVKLQSLLRLWVVLLSAAGYFRYATAVLEMEVP